MAISLVGDPKVVFLDEPTTGLDPENRRQLWDIISESKSKRAMVLTTHSMEEADVLCNRIGMNLHFNLYLSDWKIRNYCERSPQMCGSASETENALWRRISSDP